MIGRQDITMDGVFRLKLNFSNCKIKKKKKIAYLKSNLKCSLLAVLERVKPEY